MPIVLALLRYTYLVEGGRGAKPEDLILADQLWFSRIREILPARRART